jgi:hypothetical protein
MTDSFLRALGDAKSEMFRLIAQRQEIDLKLAKLKQTVDALSSLCDRPVPEIELRPQSALTAAIGLTDAMRKVMSDAKLPMTVPQIRDALLDLGYDVNQYASGLTVIHNTINRLEKQGELTRVKTPAGAFVGWLYHADDAEKLKRFGLELIEPPAGLSGYRRRFRRRSLGQELRDRANGGDEKPKK